MNLTLTIESIITVVIFILGGSFAVYVAVTKLVEQKIREHCNTCSAKPDIHKLENKIDNIDPKLERIQGSVTRVETQMELLLKK